MARHALFVVLALLAGLAAAGHTLPATGSAAITDGRIARGDGPAAATRVQGGHRAVPRRTAGAEIVPPADHHMHVRSPDAVEAFRRGQAALDQIVIPDERLVPLDGSDAVAALDSAGIERGVILSVAYMFGLPEIDFADEYPKVRAENDFVAEQVRRHPDRLVGFFSVNPLADYAIREIERAAEVPGLTGLKLHFGNSDVDLRSPEDVERLRQVFAKAGELSLPVVVHLRTRNPEYGRRDAEIFLREVLPAAPDVPVQIAHLGGQGGYDDATRQVVGAFLSAMEARPERTANLFFELSAVPQPPALARGDTALARRVREMNAVVADAFREIGLDRIVYGTDWDAIGVALYLEEIRDALPMSDEAIRDLLDDPAPYLEATQGS